MVTKALIEQLQRDFAFLSADPEVLGIFLYGSQVTGDATPRSDIDICIVTRSSDPHQLYLSLREIWVRVPVNLLKYDVRMFHELPLFIQKDVIEMGQVVCTPDEPALYEYLYPFRKRWEDQRFRQQLSPEELDAFFR